MTSLVMVAMKAMEGQEARRRTEHTQGAGLRGGWGTGRVWGRGPVSQVRAPGSNPRDRTFGLEPSGSNSLRARGLSWYAAYVRGTAVSPTGVGTYLNV